MISNSNLINGYLCKDKEKNRIYLSHQNFNCPYCVKPGPKKIYSNLWRLGMHLKTQHQTEPRINEIIENIADLIKRGILREIKN